MFGIGDVLVNISSPLYLSRAPQEWSRCVVLLKQEKSAVEHRGVDCLLSLSLRAFQPCR